MKTQYIYHHTSLDKHKISNTKEMTIVVSKYLEPKIFASIIFDIFKNRYHNKKVYTTFIVSDIIQ